VRAMKAPDAGKTHTKQQAMEIGACLFATSDCDDQGRAGRFQKSKITKCNKKDGVRVDVRVWVWVQVLGLEHMRVGVVRGRMFVWSICGPETQTAQSERIQKWLWRNTT
jgi:hypothetical protein